MKALEKDRSRRYETASGFARDVQRYLNDEQVLACPPAAVYRLRKFARRNKSGLAVAGLVLFFLVLIPVGSLVAALQLDQTNTQLTIRNQELTKARQVADARLYQAELERARAQRWSRRPGQRFVALEALSEAVSLLPLLAISEEERASRRRSMRDEAIACLTLVDVHLERGFVFNPPVDHNVVCDRQMTRYAVSDGKGNIRVHRLAATTSSFGSRLLDWCLTRWSTLPTGATCWPNTTRTRALNCASSICRRGGRRGQLRTWIK